MEIIIESFLIFTCLMFWIMFYNKKGLLAEIKNTEKKISEKIIVLEDLLDSVKQKPLFAEPDLQQSFDLNFNPNLGLKMDHALDLKPNLKSTEHPEVEAVTLPQLDLSEKTELRVLSLEDASRLDFIGDENELSQATTQMDSLEALLVTPEDDGLYSSDEEPRLSQGVTDKVLEALDNFNKIDVSEPIQIKSFRDVVLMSKKIEHE